MWPRPLALYPEYRRFTFTSTPQLLHFQSTGTPLHLAAKNGHAAIVRILLAHPHVNVNVEERASYRRKGRTALAQAQAAGLAAHAEVVALIETHLRAGRVP